MATDFPSLRSLTYREREILKLRFGLSDGYTYSRDEVAKIFKVTIGRVRSMEAKAIDKLRVILAGRA
jgi:RNA polymerase primary sigma factor